MVLSPPIGSVKIIFALLQLNWVACSKFIAVRISSFGAALGKVVPVNHRNGFFHGRMTSNCFRAICNFSLTRRASSTSPACSHVASKSCKPAMRSTFFLIRSNRSVSRFRVDLTSPERRLCAVRHS